MTEINSKLLTRMLLMVGALTVAMLAGCGQQPADNSSAAQAEIDQLQIEIEQLANAVGRLEFRVYELEDHHSDGADDLTNSETDASPDSNSASGKRYDLTPVE